MCRADLARMRGDVEAEQAFARAALAHVTEQDELLGAVARYQVAFGDLLAGRVVAAERALADVFAERVASAQHDLVPRAAFDLGAAQLARGHLRAAQRTYEQGLRVTEGDRPSPSAGMLHVGLAEVHFERDELADAHRLVADGHRAMPQARVPPGPDRGPDRPRAAPARAGRPGGRARRRRRGRPGDAPGRARPAPPGGRAARACSRWPAAMSRRRRSGCGRRASPSTTSRRTCAKREQRVLVRVLIAEHEPAAALAVLERWRALARSPGTHRERAAAAAAGGAGAPRRGRPHRGAAGPRRGARARRAGGLRARVPRRGRGRSGRCCASWRRAVASNSSARGRSPASFLAGLADGVRPPRRPRPAAAPRQRGRARAAPRRCPPASTRCSR